MPSTTRCVRQKVSDCKADCRFICTGQHVSKSVGVYSAERARDFKTRSNSTSVLPISLTSAIYYSQKAQTKTTTKLTMETKRTSFLMLKPYNSYTSTMSGLD